MNQDISAEDSVYEPGVVSSNPAGRSRKPKDLGRVTLGLFLFWATDDCALRHAVGSTAPRVANSRARQRLRMQPRRSHAAPEPVSSGRLSKFP